MANLYPGMGNAHFFGVGDLEREGRGAGETLGGGDAKAGGGDSAALTMRPTVGGWRSG